MLTLRPLRHPRSNLPRLRNPPTHYLSSLPQLVKKLAAKYDGFVCSDTLIKLIPRLLGPGLNRAGKFPMRCGSDEDLLEKINELTSTIKFQLKKVMCMNVAVGNTAMTQDELELNVTLACNFLASLTKKGWQNIKVLYIKSSMGPSQQIHF
jgi:large subunit ribosomal protein L10Ae